MSSFLQKIILIKCNIKQRTFSNKNLCSFRNLNSIANIQQHQQENQTKIIQNNNNSEDKFSKLLKIKNDDILEFHKIPSAKKLPLFGTTLDLIASGSAPNLHKYIDKRHKQLGHIFREKLGSEEIVFVSSPNLMRSVFLYEGQYPKHPLPEAWIVYNKKHNCKRGLFFMNGSEWLRNRRIMNKLMLNNNVNNWMRPLIDATTNKIIENWRNQTKSTNEVEISDLEHELYQWSINVIISLMFGSSFNQNTISWKLQEIINEFTQNVNKIFHDSSKLMNFPPKIAEFLKLSIWTNFEQNVHKVLLLGYQIIDLGLNEFGFGNGLLSMMLENQMPLDDVKRIFVDLIIAAGDTTAFSSQWTLYTLSTNENIRTKLRSIILNEENHHLNTDLPYIRGLIREVLRLYPVAPFIGRYLASDAILGNYKVKKGTLVILSLYTSGRDENNFTNALTINPERWLRGSNKSNNHECSNISSDTVSLSKGTIPFAIGSRSCIGRKIALHQMQTLINKVISNFELKCLNEKHIDVTLRLVAVPDNKIRLQIKKLN